MIIKKKKFIILSIIGVLIAASSFFLYSFTKSQYEYTVRTDKINGYFELGKYQEAIDYIDDLIELDPKASYLYSKKGFALIKLDKNEEAIQVLNTAVKLNPLDGTAFNNLSWACYNIDKYSEALDYSTKSLAINHNDVISLVNKGNALLALKRYDEAVETFKSALGIRPGYDSALYGLGITYYETGDYNSSIDNFIKYNSIHSDDPDSYLYLSEDYYYIDNYSEALYASTKALGIDPKNLDALFYKGMALGGLGKNSDAIECFNNVIKDDSNYVDAYLYKGVSLYYENNIKGANECYDKAISLDNTYSTPYVWKAKSYMFTGQYQTALNLCSKALEIDPKDSFACLTQAKIDFQLYRDDDAMKMADKALEIDPGYEDAYVEKASLLYDHENYQDCLSTALAGEKQFPNDKDLLWYAADCKAYFLQHSDAIDLYKKVLAMDSKNEDVMESIAEEYFYLQDYKDSQIYADMALAANPKDKSAVGLESSLKEANLPEGQRIVNFIKSNYLYLKEVKGFNDKAATFMKKKDPSVDDISNFLKSVQVDNDRFSYLISGADYDVLSQEENVAHVNLTTLKNNIYCIQFSEFTHNIAYEFKDKINSIKDPQNATLVIDLRNNPGGLADSANGILDFLLGKCTMDSMEDRSGKSISYSSDKNQIKFKKIIVMVNENSASSSELLTLGLKRNLNNVTVIGHKTFGKGVGQVTFENINKKYILFITSFKWNVGRTNINGIGITPDITINGSWDDDYFNEVYKLAS